MKLHIFIPGLLLLLLVSACQGMQEPPAKDESRLSLNESLITVPASGGRYGVGYHIENPVPDGLIVCSSSSDRIRNFSTEDNTLSFDVRPNETEEPQTVRIDIIYSGSDQQLALLVEQEAFEKTPDFEISITETGTSSVTFDIVPADGRMTYIRAITEQANLANISSEEEFLKNEIAYYRLLAESQGMTLDEFLGLNLQTGAAEGLTASGLLPETEYSIYAFGLTVQGELLTGLSRMDFRTEELVFNDMTFDIDCQVSGSLVTLRITPSDSQQTYLINAVKESDFTDTDQLAEEMQLWLNDQYSFYGQFGMSVPDVIREIASVGEETLELELEENTSYVAFAVSVDPEIGLLNSEFTTQTFRTETATAGKGL